jgi:hypothetical protein
MKNEIFNILIKHSVTPSHCCGIPLPASYFAHKLNISLYKCKKHLHELKEQGLVEVVRGGYYDEYYGENILYCGWYITKKAEKTQVYKEEIKKELI